MSRISFKRAPVVVVALLCAGLVSRAGCDGGVPEPGITLYGQVLAEDGSLVAHGRLVWTFSPWDGDDSLRVAVATDLTPVGTASGTTYSYLVHIPAEMQVGSTPISANRLPVSATAAAYLREAALDGAFTWPMSNVTSTTFSFAERGKVERVDLRVGVGGPPDVPSNPSPPNGAQLVPLDVTLDWADSARAETYDLYLWQAVTPVKPSVPTVTGLTASSYLPPLALRSDTDHLWQVVARNSRGSTTGPQWAFRTGFQTDLQKLLEYLLGMRQLSFAEQSVFDLNGDRLLDIADFVLGLKRTAYQGRPPETASKPSAALLADRMIALGSEWVDPDMTLSVMLPVEVTPDCTGVAGINLHVEADATVVTFLGVKPNRINPGEDVYFYCPRPNVMNVAFFTNPVNPLRATGATILWLDLRVRLPREYQWSPVHLTAAAMSDAGGNSIAGITRADGSIQSRGPKTRSSNWELYR